LLITKSRGRVSDHRSHQVSVGICSAMHEYAFSNARYSAFPEQSM
jgi:hypothetical protein